MTLKRYILLFIFIAVIVAVSNIIARTTNLCASSLFESSSLFTYFGVLIGFALTIYTFGLSMVDGIKQKVDSHTQLSQTQKTEIYSNLVSGFDQIKGNIWFIFYSVLLVIVFAIVKDVENPFGWNVENWKVPETGNLTLFLTTTVAMWDIIKTLFNLSEINFRLNR